MNHRKSAFERGYGNRWQKARATYLAKNPLCRMCADRGMIIKADVVDHITPHKGDQSLFWDKANWQSLCKPCHDSAKQRIEKRGFDHAVGADGFPIDPCHPANLVNGGGDIS